jgi:hypothetical protein
MELDDDEDEEKTLKNNNNKKNHNDLLEWRMFRREQLVCFILLN